ncbi:MAG: hypothetical protein SPI49_03305 [Eubacteriales bacterium]|nr:hypothetical protein [Eubacteriales bacterium]
MNEIIKKISEIKTAANRIEIRGEENATYLLFICQNCDEIIKKMGEISDGNNIGTSE